MRKQNFSEKVTFFVCVSGGKKFSVLEKFCVRTKLMIA